jgi:hypothetical protein
MADSQTWNGGTDAANRQTGADGPLSGIKEKAASMANEQKDRAADSLGGIADVASHTSDELRGQSELLASWVQVASDQLRAVADRMRDKQPGEMAEDITRFARQRPMLFIGGAFLLGVVLARLPRNSPSARRAVRSMMPDSSIGSGSSTHGYRAPSETGDVRSGGEDTAWPPA